MSREETAGKRWSLAYLNVAEPPQGFTQKYGDVITELDLSYNKIADLRFLAEFSALESLVLDHNLLTSHTKVPELPRLHTLWVNHNRITNLGMFVSTIATYCPNLRILSMMNNDAAPSFFNGGSYQQYMDYRYYVISRLPKLEILDYTTITSDERDEATRIYGTGLAGRRKSHHSTKLDRSAAF